MFYICCYRNAKFQQIQEDRLKLKKDNKILKIKNEKFQNQQKKFI